MAHCVIRARSFRPGLNSRRSLKTMDPEPRPDVSYISLFRVPGFGRFAATILLGRGAQSMWLVGIVLFVLARSHSAGLAGLVVFLGIFPALLLSPLAGALIDRYGRVRFITFDYFVAAVSLVAIVTLSFTQRLTPGLMMPLVVLGSLTGMLSAAGLRTMVPLMLPRHLWDRGNAADSVGYTAVAIAGPALAGGLVGWLGGEGALLVAGAGLAAGGGGVGGDAGARSPGPVQRALAARCPGRHRLRRPQRHAAWHCPVPLRSQRRRRDPHRHPAGPGPGPPPRRGGACRADTGRPGRRWRGLGPAVRAARVGRTRTHRDGDYRRGGGGSDGAAAGRRQSPGCRRGLAWHRGGNRALGRRHLLPAPTGHRSRLVRPGDSGVDEPQLLRQPGRLRPHRPPPALRYQLRPARQVSVHPGGTGSGVGGDPPPPAGKAGSGDVVVQPPIAGRRCRTGAGRREPPPSSARRPRSCSARFPRPGSWRHPPASRQAGAAPGPGAPSAASPCARCRRNGGRAPRGRACWSGSP